MTGIIGGAKPTGKFGPTYGEGIFGYKQPGRGLWGGSAYRPAKTPDGIFFEPYSYTWYEHKEPQLGWSLERWPGVPLYPGSWAHGLNLIGPSMGGLGAANGGGSGIPWGAAALGALLGVGLAYAAKRGLLPFEQNPDRGPDLKVGRYRLLDLSHFERAGGFPRWMVVKGKMPIGYIYRMSARQWMARGPSARHREQAFHTRKQALSFLDRTYGG